MCRTCGSTFLLYICRETRHSDSFSSFILFYFLIFFLFLSGVCMCFLFEGRENSYKKNMRKFNKTLSCEVKIRYCRFTYTWKPHEKMTSTAKKLKLYHTVSVYIVIFFIVFEWVRKPKRMATLMIINKVNSLPISETHPTVVRQLHPWPWTKFLM